MPHTYRMTGGRIRTVNVVQHGHYGHARPDVVCGPLLKNSTKTLKSAQYLSRCPHMSCPPVKIRTFKLGDENLPLARQSLATLTLISCWARMPLSDGTLAWKVIFQCLQIHVAFPYTLLLNYLINLTQCFTHYTSLVCTLLLTNVL